MTDCHRLAFWPTNSSRKNWCIMGTSNNHTHRDYGNMSLAQCGSTYVWMILVLSILEENIFNIYMMQYERNIWNCGRLDRQPILQDYMEMELRETPCGSCYASTCHETTHKIQPRCPLETTALPVCTQFHQIWQIQPIAFSPWWKSSPRLSTEETRPTNCWQLPLLYASSGSYYINGIVGNSLAPSVPNWDYNETCRSISWLHVDTSICNYPVPCLWHDSQCSLWRIVLLCTKKLAAKLVVTSSLAVSHTIKTHLNERSHSYHMRHPQACCCFRRRSRTGCTFPERARS